MPIARRRSPRLVLLLPVLVLLGAAPSSGAPPVVAASSSATVQAVGDTLRLMPADTSGRARRTVTIQHMLTEADSLLRLRGGVHAAETQLFLSWNAPWGQPRARTSLAPRCNDTTAVDTLYLSFLPGRPSQAFNGFSARLAFRSAASDTLGPWWHMESRGGENGGNLLVEFGPSDAIPGPQPWTVAGQAVSQLKRDPREVDLTLLFAVNHSMAQPIVADRIYTLCRVIVRHRRATRLAGCGQPVCIEWVLSTLGFALKDEPEVRRGERFVTYGAGAVSCAPWREARTPSWRPKPSR